jgi:hypothetical protein
MRKENCSVPVVKSWWNVRLTEQELFTFPLRTMPEPGHRASFQSFFTLSGFFLPPHLSQFVQRVLVKNKLSTGKGRRVGALGSEAR